MKNEEKMYQLKLTKRQAQLLSWACDSIARIIEGQDHTYQDFMESAWEKRCKAATGEFMSKEWDGGWHEMRADAEELCRKMKKRFWGLGNNELNGIYYDKTADILWDIHRVIRHQLWRDNPDRSDITVDSENPTSSIGEEPLAEMERITK